jgi:hypothetical protein
MQNFCFKGQPILIDGRQHFCDFPPSKRMTSHRAASWQSTVTNSVRPCRRKCRTFCRPSNLNASNTKTA